MDVKNYAVIDEETNVIINVILWDGESNWVPPVGSYVVCIEGTEAGIGWKYENEQFTDIRSSAIE